MWRRNSKGNTNVRIYVQVHFTIAVQFYVYVNVKLYLHAFVQLYGGEKQVWWNGFIILLVHNIGDGYDQSSRGERIKRSEMRSMRFDWPYPHLYNYLHPYDLGQP